MPQPNIRVVSRFAAKPDRVEEVKRILNELVEPTRAEDGCINYELLQNAQDPTDFTFVEEWTSEAALMEPLATDHIKDCNAQIFEHLETASDIRVYEVVK